MVREGGRVGGRACVYACVAVTKQARNAKQRQHIGEKTRDARQDKDR